MNVLGYRLIHGGNIIWQRSRCIHCRHTIAWYDLIPVISYIMLGGKCRSCAHTISWLYPFIELITAISLSALYCIIEPHYFFAYFLFFSALIVTIRSDLETMLISRYVTLALIPVAFLLSIVGWLPISLFESLIGAFGGYLFLYGIARIFYWFTKKKGIGEGDFELLAFIGSFIGFFGSWITLFLGSIVGSIFGIGFILITKSNKSAKIPFGPFLAFAAMGYVVFQDSILNLIYASAG